MAARTLWCACLWALMSQLGVSSDAVAQLGKQGDAYTVAGQARFLTFISYFDGLDAGPASWSRDFQWMRGKVDGIRVFPNWWAQLDPLVCDRNTVIDVTSGPAYVNQPRLDVLKQLIEAAARHELIVEVALSRETLCGMPKYPAPPSPEQRQNYLSGVSTLASQLVPYDHVIIDAQNEWNHVFGGEDDTRLAQIAEIRDAIRSRHASRLIVASMDMNGSPSVAADMVLRYRFDGVAYHERRTNGAWFDIHLHETLGALRRALGSTPAPIFLNEPRHWQEGASNPTQNRSEFQRAVRHAKCSGAAAWTFHTETSFHLDGAALIDVMPQDEKDTIASLEDHERGECSRSQ
jgi:hypothetical protein